METPARVPPEPHLNRPILDRSLCRKDGACTRVCPTGLLHLGPDGFPELQPDPAYACLECGHCAAACPRGAISAGGARAGELEPLRDGWRLDGARVGQLLRGRRSVRNFKPEPLARALVEELISMAQHAPSGLNSQPIEWIVVEGRQRVREVAEATAAWMRRLLQEGSPLAAALGMPGLLRAWESGRDVLCRGAPQLLVAHAAAENAGGPTAGAIAITYVELAAIPLGAGACWAGYVAIAAGLSPEVAHALRLPEGRRCCGALLAGRPDEKYFRIPRRRKPVVEWR